MNFYERDILNTLRAEPFVNQRTLAETSGHSVGIVNKSLKALTDSGYLDASFCLTDKAREEFSDKSPMQAVILAAGFGMRMVPINNVVPKALLQVNNEPLIERIIKQLHEVGITKIYVVVGYMKEAMEYLIDEYGAELIINPEYSTKNNLHSLFLAREHLENSYIIPSDIWTARSPFSSHELYPWYMVSDLSDEDSTVRVNRKNELVAAGSKAGNKMIGIAYLTKDMAATVKANLERCDADRRFDDRFWEEAIVENEKMLVAARVVSGADAIEINTYEQLRDLDLNSEHLKSDVIGILADALNASPMEIENITVLKKGMTNRSFLFSCRGKRFIMRLPGEGTDQLIDRKQEADVYRTINDRDICDRVVYINPDNGYKITEYIDNARTCDAFNDSEVRQAMKYLRQFHSQGLRVGHTFDIFGQISFYEGLWNGAPSVYKDYHQVKQNVLSLKSYIDANAKPYVLTHIDAVPDNFLFFPQGDGEQIRLIDWEYAGMQDPDVDIAMFCIYALYDRRRVDDLIKAYYTEGCSDATRIKIYCYISACGLLWSNWSEYKRSLGVEFGEYALRQYRYAKDYYHIVKNELEGSGAT